MATDVNFGTQLYFNFDPRSIPNCYIWSDANTLSGLANGTTVNSWSNLGSGGTVTATGTTSNAVLNNRTVVNFTTAQTWTTGTTVNLSRYSMFAVQRQTGTNRRVLQSVTNNQLFGYWNGYKRALYVDGNPNQLTTALSDTAWDLMAHTRIASGAYTFNWNGTSLFTGTGAATNLTGLAINTSSTAPAETSTCQIAEILLYSSVLSTQQVQQVEGYLAWKWGLQANLPTSHPFKRNPPAMRLFQPTDVMNCAVWVDPADRSSILALSGNQPTSIRSKGHQLITLDNSQPTNNAGVSVWTSWPPPSVTNYGTQFMTNTSSNLNTLQFTRTIGSGGAYGNGYNGSYLRIPSITFTSQQRTIFFVHSPQSTGLDSYAHVFAPTNWTGATNVRQRGYIDNASTAYSMYPITASGTELLVCGAVAPYTGAMPTNGTPYIFAARHTTSTASNYVSVNGTSLTPLTNQALSTGYLTGTDEYVLGIFFAYTRQFLLGDFLLYDGPLQDSEIRQIEGYLAWKWGLRASIPTTHPYYNFPPATALFVPPTLSNLAFWIDAADPSTVTSNASSVVTQVLDKGPNARNLTNALTTTGFTWNVTKFNSIYPSFYYNGGQTVTLGSNSSFSVSQPATVFTVQQVVGSAVNQDVFDSTNSGNRMFGFYFINAGTANYRIFAGTTLLPAGAPSTFNPVVVSHYFNSTTSQIFENGTSTVTGDAGTQGLTGITIGSRNTQNQETFQGHIAEVIIYSRRLSQSERQRVEGYLAWKWGVQDKLPTTHPYYKFRP